MRKRVVQCLAAGSLAVLMIWTLPGISQQPDKTKSDKAAAKTADKAPVAPASGVKAAVSRVAAVTVYPNSALVTREVDVPAGAGSIELTVTPLPPTTVDSSLYAEGTENLRVLTTRFRTRQVLEDTREDVRKLQEELKQIQQSRDKLEAESKTIQSNMQLLTKLENFTGATTVAAADKNALNAESVIALTKHIMTTRGDQQTTLVGIQQQMQSLTEKAEFANRKLRELAASSNRTEREAIIVVEKTNPGAGKVRLSYLVDSATWRPMYKLRAGKTTKEQIQLEYLAAVTQNTGEDWSSVKLALSTAQPTLNAAPPELHTLNVAVIPKGAAPAPQLTAMDLEAQSKSLRGRAQKDYNEKKAMSGAGLFNAAAALDQSWELLNPEAAVKRGCALTVREGPSVTYHLTTALSVPSRNDEQVLEVTRLEMPPEYYYKAVPVLTAHIYRQADLTNRSAYVLLPGDATMYIGTDFVGQMSMPLVAIGESFTAGFGIDPQLQIQRQMVDKTKTTQGGNQSLRYEYRILISSYKSERVKLQVWDRLPHAESDAVGVNLVKTAPDLSKDALYLREQRPTNLLRWDVQVDPGTTGEKALAINYEFKLELDRQMTIGSFQSASLPTSTLHPAAVATAPAAAAPAVNAAEEAKFRAALAKLSAEDRPIAEAQRFCAVDQDALLGLEGPILKVMCKGQPVFLCCKGCERHAQQKPDDTLAKLANMMNSRGPKK